MARQPFLPTYQGKPAAIGASVIEEVPRLAELVGRIAINWSGVEVQLSLALGSMLGVENAAAVAVFLSLRNHRAQRDALRAAADKSLSEGDAEIFEALLARHAELDKQRNDVVHCVWGKSEATPDGILWSSQQDHANMLITAYHLEQTGQLTYETTTHNMTKDLFVIRYADLEELNKTIIALDHSIMNFHAYLRYRSQVAGQNAYRALLSDPVIAAKRGIKPAPQT
jgi:hypothetical protein